MNIADRPETVNDEVLAINDALRGFAEEGVELPEVLECLRVAAFGDKQRHILPMPGKRRDETEERIRRSA